MTKMGSLHWTQLARAIEHYGARHVRTKGDHMIYWKEGLSRPIVFPKDDALGPTIILCAIKALGVDREEFLEVARRRH